MSRDICIDRLRARAKKFANEPAYYSKRNQKFEAINWKNFHDKVRQFSKALIANGCEPNDKVSILGFNRLEWVVSCIGAQYAGNVSVGVYPSSAKEEVAFVVDHSDSKVLVVENLDRFKSQVEPIKSQLPKVSHFVLMNGESNEDFGVTSFEDFLLSGKNISDQILEDRFNDVDPESVASMIYTSGTTGQPKSVMLSHKSIAWTVRVVVQSWRCGSFDHAISYLPMAHIAEQMFSVYAPIDCGMKQYFAESFEALPKHLQEVKPTVFFGVPRVYEKMYEKLRQGLQAKGFITNKLVSYFSDISMQVIGAQNSGRLPNLWLNGQYNFARKKIFSSIKEKMGFSNIRMCMCGAAPIAKEILDFFCGIDLPIYEVYGQSENSGPAAMNIQGQARLGSVGKPLPETKVKIASDGEILIQGPHLFLGYYKNEEATNEAMKDGWLYTGDIGEIDQDGYLRITDRKKDILITAGGKNIAPQVIEGLLKNLPYVQSAVVVGDRKKYLCALFSPDHEHIKSEKAKIESDQELQIKLLDEIKLELQKINNRLAPVEQIKKFKLLQNEFSVDSGEFTPTMKVKRKFVNEKYKSDIDELYN